MASLPQDPQVGRVLVRAYHLHQQPEENYLPCFSQLISLERYTLRVYRAGEIDLFENLDIVHIRFQVAVNVHQVPGGCQCFFGARLAHPA